MCAVEYGIAEQALFMTANYSGERKQFGVPIATFQGVTQRIGDAYIDVQVMRSSMWQACWRLDQGLDADKELAVAKFFASEAGARVVPLPSTFTAAWASTGTTRSTATS